MSEASGSVLSGGDRLRRRWNRGKRVGDGIKVSEEVATRQWRGEGLLCRLWAKGDLISLLSGTREEMGLTAGEVFISPLP